MINAQTLNISLPKDLIKEVDKLAKKEYSNRSDFIRQALIARLKEKNEWEQIFKAGEKAMKDMGIKNEEEVNEIVYKYRHGRKSRKSNS